MSSGFYGMVLIIDPPYHASNEPTLMAHWLCHRLMGWYVLGSHVGTGFNTVRVFNSPLGRCKVTTPFSLTSTRVKTNY